MQNITLTSILSMFSIKNKNNKNTHQNAFCAILKKKKFIKLNISKDTQNNKLPKYTFCLFNKTVLCDTELFRP